MQVVKVFNNNVVQAQTNLQQEVIVMGRGIGFQKKKGDLLDEDKIDKTFMLTDQMASFAEIYRELPAEEVDLVIEIVDLAEKKLQQTFQSTLYITLADHLHYAIERSREGIFLKNPLTWEIRKFYSEAYQIEIEALVTIDERLNIKLSQDEAASIALHY